MANKGSDQWMKSGKSPRKTTKKPLNTRSAYSVDEDEKILRYILIDDRRSQIKGRALWETMARKKVVGNRTWQSLKNRFLKSILSNLHKFDITSADREKLVPGMYDKDSNGNHVSDSANEDSKSRSRTKKYAIRTDEDMLKFLIERKKFDQLSGNEIWKEMVHLNVTRHTWQSMRNRFLSHILKNIDSYNISDYAKKEFKAGKFFQEISDTSDDDSIPDIQDSSGDDTDISIDDGKQSPTRDDTNEQGDAIETADKVDEEPQRCIQNLSPVPNESHQNGDQVPEISAAAGPSEKSNTMEGLAVTRKLKPKEKTVLGRESTDSDTEDPIECMPTYEEDMLFATPRQNDLSQPSLEIPSDVLQVSAANEPFEDEVVEHPDTSHSDSSNTVDEFVNSALEVPDKSGPLDLPLDDAIETAAVVYVNCRSDSSTSGESLKSLASANALEFDTCSVSDIETNSNLNEIEQHSPVQQVAQNVETEQSNIINVSVHDDSLHEDDGEADNNDIGDGMLELTEGLKTIDDIKRGVEVDGENFRNMIQCAADIIGVTPEELLQLWI